MTARSSRGGASVALVAMAAALGSGCGDLYADPIIQGSGGSSQAPSPVQPRPPSAPTPLPQRDLRNVCPQQNVVEGGPCASVGAICEQGSSPDTRCNTTLECVPQAGFGTIWTARPSLPCATYECPKGESAPIDGTPCNVPTSDAGAPSASDELVCPMTDAVCACTTGVDAKHAHARTWVCVKPAGYCPATRPLVGAPCTSSGSQCDYGSCNFKRGMRMECKDNAWGSASVTCS